MRVVCVLGVARMQLLRGIRDYRKPRLPSPSHLVAMAADKDPFVLSGLTSGLFSRAGEKPRQWICAHLKVSQWEG